MHAYLIFGHRDQGPPGEVLAALCKNRLYQLRHRLGAEAFNPYADDRKSRRAGEGHQGVKVGVQCDNHSSLFSGSL